MDTHHTCAGFSRRHALAGGAAVGLGLPLLAACGDGGSSATDGSTDAPPPSGALTTTSEIEVGGGAIFADQRVVVTQPTEGDFKAFSAACTHQGCTVNDIVGSEIRCPCHGSAFSIEDGSVVGGPAPKPLPEVEISVKGDQISVV